jgi:hypothetical protein
MQRRKRKQTSPAIREACIQQIELEKMSVAVHRFTLSLGAMPRKSTIRHVALGYSLLRSLGVVQAVTG